MDHGQVGFTDIFILLASTLEHIDDTVCIARLNKYASPMREASNRREETYGIGIENCFVTVEKDERLR
jgi:hypothetical protein